MKKIVTAIVAALTLATLVPVASAAPAEGRGGPLGGLIGCCFGIRAAADYNEGKTIAVREWMRIVPFVSVVFAVIDCVDGWKGTTRSELHASLPTYF